MILVINICKEPLHYFEFVKPIEDILRNSKIGFKTRHYLELKEEDLKADKIIICGTSLKDNKFLNNINKFKFLLDFKKSVLGICGGSHIIGLLLGFKIKKETRIGLKKIQLKKEFLGIKGEINTYHLHQYQLLPEIFKKNNFYATLFHPEVRNKKMIENFAAKPFKT